jgi:hypothetical protein
MTRRDIIEKATIECLDEMYRQSQPSITWDEVIEQSRQDKDRHIWREHYLPQHLYMKIMEKYMYAYRIQDEWTSNVRVIEEYLEKGGTKDKYIAAYTDATGYHPGHRGYEKVESIAVQFQKKLKEMNVEHGSSIAMTLSDLLFSNIKDCKEFYKINREEMGFRMDVSNYSPNSNIEDVREFYKDTDIVINETPKEDEEYD